MVRPLHYLLILSQDLHNLLLLHALKERVGILAITLLHVVFNEHGKYVAKSDRFVHALLVDQHFADLSHGSAVAIVLGLAGLAELFDVLNSLGQSILLHVLVVGVRLVQLGFSLLHRA